MKITVEVPESAFSITKECPDDFARSLRVAAAIKWYELGKISQSKASELIGCTRIKLFDYFREYGVPIVQATPEEIDQELADPRI